MSEETASQPQVRISWLIGIAAAFAIFALIGSYSSRMTWNTTDYDRERASQRYQTLAKLQSDEGKQLNPVDAAGKPTAIWVDQDKGLIAIPIEEAMAKEIDDLKAKAPVAGCEINPAPPVPAPTAAAPAAAIAPAPPATNSAPAAPAPPAAKAPAPAPKTTPPSAKPKK